LGTIGAAVVAVLIVGALFWSSLGILLGTEGLTGITESVPKPVSYALEPVRKGESDWVSWHGADGDRRSGTEGITRNWSEGLKKLWEVDYLCQDDSSASWASPVVQGNRLIVTGRSEGHDLVFCLNPSNGDLLWQTSYRADADADHGAGPRATPAIEEDRVYTFGRSGDLVAWSLLDGRELWQANVADEGGEAPTWGYASSPLLLGELIVVQGGGGAGTIAYDKLSGKAEWKSSQNMAGYAALSWAEVGGKPMIFAFHGKGLAALDAENGNEFWNLPWETPYDVNATTPIVIGDRIFISSGYGTGGMLLRVDRLAAEILWRNKAIASQHSDPYAIDGFLYGYSGDSSQNKGAFKCVSLADGTERWATNEMGWGTCIFVDAHLLCCDIKGNIFLTHPDPDRFVRVTGMHNALGDVKGPVWTRPVVANGLLYLRFKQRLVCYDLMRQ